jgi:predicted RNA methylase
MASDERGVVLSSDFDAMLARRNAQVAACEYVDRVLKEQPEGFPRLFFSDGREWDKARAIREAEREAWSELVTGTGLYTFMDATARREWSQHLDSGKLLEFTAENAAAFAEGLHAQRGAMVKRGVGDCFRRLSGHYATNKPDRFGRRMILTRVLTTYGSGRGAWWTTNSRACDDLDDLVRVLRLLRGLGEPDHRRGAHWAMREAGADNSSGAWPREVAFDYFTVRVFKNGNGHLTFRHDEDVLRLNKVLSMETDGMTLAPSARTRERKPAPAVDPNGDLAYFATPAALARELVSRCGVEAGDLCLEPSAGTGAIVGELVRVVGGARVRAVEVHHGRAVACGEAHNVNGVVADFLAWDTAERFDRIVMNPPFSLPGHDLADIDHVMHAASMLAPGGRLVAVMSAAFTFRASAKAFEFRDWLNARGATVVPLPDGSFAENGTMVRTVVVTIDG